MKKIILKILFLLLVCLPVNSEIKIKPITEGNVDAKIKLIVYESLTCGHCADFHKNVYPELKEQYIDTGLATIEFRSFPLDLAALNASKVAHCKNDGKSEILHFLFINQSKWAKGNKIEEFNANLKKLLDDKKLGIDFNKCIDDKKIEDYVLENRIDAVKKFEINATRTIIINDKKFDKPFTFKNLKKLLVKLI
ncbi:MAG: thioredoxin domain-containing protein [Pelagibacterales bacterium]|nr:thioredoxin domain-containing protein [Pelagibacterales bacterium]